MGSPVVVASPRKSPLSGKRVNKPLVEKKRRARINGCLGQLKSLILNAMQTEQGAQVSRLEKADILEMTVKYLRQIQRQQVTVAVTSEPDVVAKFSAGYTECASEVIRYMDSVQSLAPEVKSRLESHLVERLRGSVPATTNAVTAVDKSTPFMVPGNVSQGNECYSRHVSSTSTVTDDINRHYQTAIDLANMAASVTSQEVTSKTVTTSSFLQNQQRSSYQPSTTSPSNVLQSGIPLTFSVNVSSKCTPPARIYTNNDRQCISPGAFRSSEQAPIVVIPSIPPVHGDNDTRQRLQSIETAVSHLQYSTPRNVLVEPHGGCDFNNNIVNNSQNKHFSNTPIINDYLSSYQRPLHIHIPNSPQPPSTQSPPLLQPHLSCPQGLTQSSTADIIQSFDDAPPTILYGCDGYENTAEDSSSQESTSKHFSKHVAASSANNLNQNISQYCSNSFMGNNISNTDNNSDFVSTNYIDGSELSTNIFSKKLKVVDDTIYMQDHEPTHCRLRTTPSPPILLPEESYVSGHSYSTHGNDVHSRNYLNSYCDTDKERSGSAECRVNFSANLPSSNEHYVERQTGNISYTSAEFQQPKYEFDTSSNYSCNTNKITSTINNLTRECVSEQTYLAYMYSGQCEINGPSLPQRVPSRQNDKTLSPPTLKRRLLLAQGSDDNWTTPRWNRVNADKRFIRHDAGHSESGQNTRFWRDCHESYGPFSRETNSSVPAVLLCTVPAHVVTADEGLWRPW